ncbi:MAG: hypothetical protein AAF721_11570 [Myxococcota bacterium]
MLTVGCFSESPIAATPGGPADAGSIGGDCEADADCDEGQTCSWGLCVGGDDAIEPLDGAPQPWAAVQIGCQRLHGECNDVCSNPFVNCYENAEVCAEQFTADYIKDYTFPVLDADLAARCAAQVIDQPCLDLEPDTLECNYAVHEGCVGDDDGHGTTSSPFRPGRLTLGQADSVYLCASVEEFYELELRQGQGVSVHASNAESSSLSASLHRLVPVSSDRVQLESIVSYIDINDDDDDLEPVPSDGTYLLSLRSTSNTRRVALTIHARE